MLVTEGILGCVGNTPMLRPTGLRPPGGAEILLKLEGWNPSGSVKARAAVGMLAAAQERGDLQPGQQVVEPSSGNLGIALAMACAAKGITCNLVVDPRMTDYSMSVMRGYGARVKGVSEPDERGSWQGSRLRLARQIAEDSGAYICYQYGNPDNPAAHYHTTGQEIISQVGQCPDVCVVGVSTGGQLTGIGSRLKEAGDCRMVAVDVDGSSIFGGQYHPYRLRGLGLSWWPDNLDAAALDDVYRLPEEFAFRSAMLLSRIGGIVSGGAAGAVLGVAVAEASRLGADRTVVAVIPELGDRYLNQFYDSQWRAELGYQGPPDPQPWFAECRDLEPLAKDSWVSNIPHQKAPV